MSSAVVRGNSSPNVRAYRYLLSGGAEQFSLSKWDWGLIVGAGWMVCQGFWLLGQREVFSGGWKTILDGQSALWGALIEGIGVGLGAATTAMLAARWLGRAVGLGAGLIDALMTGLAGGFLAGYCGTSDILPWVVYGMLARWSIGSFAIANLGGLLPLWRGDFVKWGFWLGLAGCWMLGGWQGTLLPVGVCLLGLVWLEDARGLRFFVFPAGWLAAGSLVVGVEILWQFGPREWTAWVGLAGGTAETVSFGGLLETSWGWWGVGILWGVGIFLAIAAAAGAWRWMTHGEIRSPGGSLFGGWAIAAGVGLLLEILRTQSSFLERIPSSEHSPPWAMLAAMLMPPWAVAASVGCQRLRVRLRRTPLHQT